MLVCQFRHFPIWVLAEPELPFQTDEPPRIRTWNQLIKSQWLCH